MSEMTDPHEGYLSFNEELAKKTLILRKCYTSQDIKCHLDEVDDNLRITYAIIENNVAKGIFQITPNGYENGMPCFQLGVAVGEKFRKQGVGLCLMQKGLNEFLTKFPIPDGKKVIIEAVVSESNIASQKIAGKIFSDAPTKITDRISGEAALLYEMVVERKS